MMGKPLPWGRISVSPCDWSPNSLGEVVGGLVCFRNILEQSHFCIDVWRVIHRVRVCEKRCVCAPQYNRVVFRMMLPLLKLSLVWRWWCSEDPESKTAKHLRTHCVSLRSVGVLYRADVVSVSCLICLFWEPDCVELNSVLVWICSADKN